MADQESVFYVGKLETELTSLKSCPRQGYEGPHAGRLRIDSAFMEGLKEVKVGSELVILTWLHQADRTRLQVHPRNDNTRPMTGVFLCRSPHRPNPIGLHEVKVDRIIDEQTLLVSPIDVIHDTPVIDVKLSLLNRSSTSK